MTPMPRVGNFMFLTHSPPLNNRKNKLIKGLARTRGDSHEFLPQVIDLNRKNISLAILGIAWSQQNKMSREWKMAITFFENGLFNSIKLNTN